MAQTVAVTGASGHVGAALLRALVERGETVRALDLRPPPGIDVDWRRADVLERKPQAPKPLPKPLPVVAPVATFAASSSAAVAVSSAPMPVPVPRTSTPLPMPALELTDDPREEAARLEPDPHLHGDRRIAPRPRHHLLVVLLGGHRRRDRSVAARHPDRHLSLETQPPDDLVPRDADEAEVEPKVFQPQQEPR